MLELFKISNLWKKFSKRAVVQFSDGTYGIRKRRFFWWVYKDFVVERLIQARQEDKSYRSAGDRYFNRGDCKKPQLEQVVGILAAMIEHEREKKEHKKKPKVTVICYETDKSPAPSPVNKKSR